MVALAASGVSAADGTDRWHGCWPCGPLAPCWTGAAPEPAASAPAPHNRVQIVALDGDATRPELRRVLESLSLAGCAGAVDIEVAIAAGRAQHVVAPACVAAALQGTAFPGRTGLIVVRATLRVDR